MTVIINSRYEVNLIENQLLGEGGQAKVYLGYDKTLHLEVAIKIYLIYPPYFYIETLRYEFLNIEKYNHNNIINYYDWGVFTYKQDVYFATIMEYANLGSLSSFKYNGEEQNLNNIHNIFIGILKGLIYIHQRGIIHRDLKPSNILLSKTKNQKINPIITDFLHKTSTNPSIRLNAVATAKFENTFGTIEYMAPELLGTINIFEGNMTDLWSFGLIVYEFFTQTLPFGSRSNSISPYDIANNIFTKELDYSILPKPYDKLVELCLAKDMAKRVHDAQILINIIICLREKMFHYLAI